MIKYLGLYLDYLINIGSVFIGESNFNILYYTKVHNM